MTLYTLLKKKKEKNNCSFKQFVFLAGFFHLQAASACLALGRAGAGEAVSRGWVQGSWSSFGLFELRELHGQRESL